MMMHLEVIKVFKKLISGIHCKRKHQQIIAAALIKKSFMWVIGKHRGAKLFK
jgi:hypothetical protein